ncbi:uncharacterized protein PAC_18203 [Phialocephala subalpina]|uniref:C2H2-type domain-containing protein n=1 Tax=Phialocephala subalpina TaxID=576137 RepID=A0A1L7XTE0_9HELO|nr:uncharacterized protein PAC_18203 [Phialocephala subalpina]
MVRIWQDSDIGTMLAWLDFSIAKHINFWDSIISKLDESRQIHTGDGFLFTTQQIQDKLIGLPREKMYDDSIVRPYPKLVEILAKGTPCLPGLAQNLVVKVHEARQRFEGDNLYSDALQPTSTLHHTTTYSEKDIPAAQNFPDATDLTNTHSPNNHHDALQSSSVCPARIESFSADQGCALLAISNSPKDIHLTRSAVQATQLSSLEDKNQRLTEENQILKNALEPGESSFYEFYRQGWDMQRRIRSMQTAIGFFDIQVPASQEFLSFAVLDERMDEVQAELQEITHCLGNSVAARGVTIIRGSKLESLIHSGFSSASDMRTADKLLDECLSSSDTLTVIITLVLTAIRDWVLDTTFPNLQDGLISSSFMGAYRTLSIDCVGPSAALNLETAAYHQFINSALFKDHLVPQTAAVLADSFLHASSCILPAGLSSDALEYLRYRLTAMFTAACHLKASSALTNSRRYQFIVYPPGPIPESNPSALSSSNQANITPQSRSQGCLKVYNTVFGNILNRQENLLLQTKNFLGADEVYSSRPYLHSKTIVLQNMEGASLSNSHQTSHVGIRNESRDIHESGSELSSPLSLLDPEDTECHDTLTPSKGDNHGSVDGSLSPQGTELQRSNAPSASKYYCSLCSQKFVSTWSLNRHKGRQGHQTRLAKTQQAKFLA